MLSPLLLGALLGTFVLARYIVARFAKHCCLIWFRPSMGLTRSSTRKFVVTMNRADKDEPPSAEHVTYPCKGACKNWLARINAVVHLATPDKSRTAAEKLSVRARFSACMCMMCRHKSGQQTRTGTLEMLDYSLDGTSSRLSIKRNPLSASSRRSAIRTLHDYSEVDAAVVSEPEPEPEHPSTGDETIGNERNQEVDDHFAAPEMTKERELCDISREADTDWVLRNEFELEKYGWCHCMRVPVFL
eukprot:COSAG05_NODE_2001_length_3722_cov_194.395446_2_plen_244_part_01